MTKAIDELTAAINAVTAARTAVDALPRMVAGADHQADMDAAGVSYGGAISALDTADRHLRVARALLAYANAEPAKAERIPTC